MSKLTPALQRQFQAAKTWLAQRSGTIKRSNISDGERVSVSALGAGRMFLLQEGIEPGDFEEGVVDAVKELQEMQLDSTAN